MMLKEDARPLPPSTNETTICGGRSQDISMMRTSDFRYGKFPAWIESWGRYPSLESDLIPLYWTTDFPPPELPLTKILPVGAGRSYGDVCLLDHGTLFATRGLDKLLHFDPQTGVLRCEAGVTLAEILDFAVPRGFFLPVTPGPSM